MQSAIERAILRSDQLREPKRAPAWLSRIVSSAVVDELRRRGRRRDLPFDEARQPLATPEAPACWCVLAQLDHLRADQATLLRRVVVDEVPISALANELGVSTNAAMVRLHRARRALRERMEAHCGTTTIRSCDECGCAERRCCPPPGDA